MNDNILKKIILGFLIGLAVIAPGISGATIAVMFKMYNPILSSIANFNKRFKESLKYLWPIVIGLILGIVIGFVLLKELLIVMQAAIIFLFAGLIFGSIKSIKPKGTKGIKYLVIGILLPVILSLISFFRTDSRLDFNYYLIIYYVIVGSFVAACQYLPGASSSAFLMSIGLFTPLVTSFSLNNLINNKELILIYSLLISGFIIGLIIYAKLFDKALYILGNQAEFLFLGFSIGSVISLFINYDMTMLYKKWYINGINWMDLLFGLMLFVLGFVISYLLSLKENAIEEK